MTRKIALLFVAAAFVAGGLGGCGKEETPGQKFDKGAKKPGEEMEKAGKELQGK